MTGFAKAEKGKTMRPIDANEITYVGGKEKIMLWADKDKSLRVLSTTKRKDKQMLGTDKDKPITGKETTTTSTDWVQVVRCKDCRYGYLWVTTRNGIMDSWIECRKNDGLNRDVPEDGFCYMGGKEDDETN